MPCDGLLDRLVVPVELVADCGPDEVRPVRVEALLHEKVHLSQIDVSQVDGDLLAIGHLRPQLAHVPHGTILPPSNWMVYGPSRWIRKGCARTRGGSAPRGREAYGGPRAPLRRRGSEHPRGCTQERAMPQKSRTAAAFD